MKQSAKSKCYGPPLHAGIVTIYFLASLAGLFPLPNLSFKNGPGKFRYLSFICFYSGCFSLCMILSISFIADEMFHRVHIYEGAAHSIGSFFLVYATFSYVATVFCNAFTLRKLGKVYQRLKVLEKIFEESVSKEVAKQFFKNGIFLSIYFWVAHILFSLFIFEKLPKGIVFQVLGSLDTTVIGVALHFPVLHGTCLCEFVSLFYSLINRRLRMVLLKKNNTLVAIDTGLPKDIHANFKDFESELESCRQLHLQVFEFSQKIGNYIAPQLLISSSSIFMLSCYQFYTSWNLVISKQIGQNLYFHLLNGITLLVSSTILGWAVDKQNGKHKETSKLIFKYHKFQNNETLDFIYLFLAQLKDTKPNMSVNGFFMINRASVLMMFGQIATYLVILVQFSIPS